MSDLVWIRALAPSLGTGWTAMAPDGRQAFVVEEETPFGKRWFVYARPIDVEMWGKPYELNGFLILSTARAYVENGFRFEHPRRAIFREDLAEAAAQVDRINGATNAR